MILVEDVYSVLVKPFLRNDVRDSSIKPPGILNSLLRYLVLILEGLIQFQKRRYILLPIQDCSIGLWDVIESGCDPGKWIVVKNSFAQKKTERVAPLGPMLYATAKSATLPLAASFLDTTVYSAKIILWIESPVTAN